MNHNHMIKPMLIGAAVVLVLGLAGLPVLNYLPLLLFLACPLMMVFMMGAMGAMGHGGGPRGEAQNQVSKREDQRDQA